ncbi:hypothetical protein [Pseudooceanicola sp.]|uniref:hypothetical protein n=1 Tax=Pseudooceanicola sp. TaxID=1914328 RepID=UPI004058F214
MEGEELRQGRRRVQDHLIAPLERQGMQRRPSASVTQHGDFLDALRNRLAYMTARNLDALAEIVANMAGGKHRDRWPVEVAIMNMARRLQIPPASESRMVRTWLQSAAGHRALAEGWHVEAFFWMKRNGMVPNDYIRAECAREAAENAAQRRRLIELWQAGRCTPSEYAEVERWHEADQRVRSIIEASQGSTKGAA